MTPSESPAPSPDEEVPASPPSLEDRAEVWGERLIRGLMFAAAAWFAVRGLSAILQGRTRIEEAGATVHYDGGLALLAGAAWCVVGALFVLLGLRGFAGPGGKRER
jgi:hypothetical protein